MQRVDIESHARLLDDVTRRADVAESRLAESNRLIDDTESRLAEALRLVDVANRRADDADARSMLLAAELDSLMQVTQCHFLKLHC